MPPFGLRPSTEEWRRFNHAVKGENVDERWVSRRTLENGVLQDREAMKEGSFTGVPGIPNQDIIMWVGMGPIVDRMTDMLGASDLAIVEFRRLMVDAARKVAEGGRAIGTQEPRVRHADIASREGVYPKTTDWRMLSAAGNANAEAVPPGSRRIGGAKRLERYGTGPQEARPEETQQRNNDDASHDFAPVQCPPRHVRPHTCRAGRAGHL